MKLTTAADRTAAALAIKTAIDEYCRVTYDDGHRTHLGASLIGHDCSRYLWYVFRWVKREQFSGRMQRLFNRGHREEARFVEWLQGIGFDVSDAAVGDKQHRVSEVFGHFGGSLDGLAREATRAELGSIENDDAAFLLEFKTSGTGQGFTNMLAKGVRQQKPQHYAQMCVYGTLRKLKYALYMMINKNDDDIHAEIVELDWNYGNELVGKAHSIIMSPGPPNKLSQSEAFFTCKYCTFKDICHNGEAIEKNCRSCRSARPVDGAAWHCDKFNGTLPKDFIKVGCDAWEGVA